MCFIQERGFAFGLRVRCSDGFDGESSVCGFRSAVQKGAENIFETLRSGLCDVAIRRLSLKVCSVFLFTV